ncbi:hypothetical protein Tco_0749353 [Tanacetum coccineum]|uniref:Uncharacterized protein n=1 Tax=Tanacetum coccineum TaxID=301880 RepID=A0ABQ4Z180_9ASTR
MSVTAVLLLMGFFTSECLAILIDAAALGKLCLAALTITYPDFVATVVGTKFLLGCGLIYFDGSPSEQLVPYGPTMSL